MVADKIISNFSENGNCGIADVTLGEAPSVKSIENFDEAKLETNGQYHEESSLDNFCEVVTSFRCKFCSFEASDRVTVKAHLNEKHSGQNRHRSLEKSSNESALNQNAAVCSAEQQPEDQSSKIAEKDEVFFCSDCSIIFSSAELCCNHIVEVHKLQSFGTDLIRENPLGVEKSSVAEPKRKRIRCSKLPPENFLTAKKSKQCPTIQHMCTLCKTKFNSTNALQTHDKCHVASVDTSNQSKKAKPSKSYVKGYVCCFCDTEKPEKFLTWGKCAFHLWKEHEVDCDLYTCFICKYKTPTLAKLKDHELIHSSEAKFTCSICRKSFKQFKQLKTHEKYHKTNQTKLAPTEESRWYTPKECPVCDRILSDSKCLKKHISAVHNKMKPYACNICGHTSARKAELQLHIRQHTGEKPYKCPACPFSTGDHNSLRKHKKRHTNSRPYECPHCDYSAIQSYSFKKHVLAIHPGQEVVFVCHACSFVSVNEKVFEAHRKDHKEGRINLIEHEAHRYPKQNNPSAPIVSADESTQVSTESTESNDGKSRAKFWLGDDESMEVIDTGGITIPASESEESLSLHQRPSILYSSEGSNMGTDKSEKTETCGSYTSRCSSFEMLSPPPHPATMNKNDHSDSLMELQEGMKDKQKTDQNDSVVVEKMHNADEIRSFTALSATGAFEPIDETRAISMVTELLAEGDSNTLNQFFLDPLLNDSLDLPDILCNEHSNDATLEKFLNMNVTGFSN